ETINYKYLPEDFERPPELLLYGDKCIGRIAVEFTTDDNYLEWLGKVAEWKKTRNISQDFCPIYYLSNTAGPDISIAFCFSKSENDMPLDKEYEE
ncbi:9294_t:CDS:1, partial [Funneliformis geosporum]